MIALGGGLALLGVAALPMIGALRPVFGFSILWIFAAAFLMLLCIAWVVRYAVRLQQRCELGVAKQSVQDGNTPLPSDDIRFDLAMKPLLLASRLHRQLVVLCPETGMVGAVRVVQKVDRALR